MKTRVIKRGNRYMPQQEVWMDVGPGGEMAVWEDLRLFGTKTLSQAIVIANSVYLNHKDLDSDIVWESPE